MEESDSLEVRVHLEDCSPQVQVNNDAQRAGQDRGGRGLRALAEWMLGVMIGLAFLALLRIWFSVLVRRRVATRLRIGLGVAMSSKAVLLGMHFLIVYVAYMIVHAQLS